MTLPAAPEPTPPRLALAQLEAAATGELVALAAQLPPPRPAHDPLLAHLAWDLGLTGSAVADEH